MVDMCTGLADAQSELGSDCDIKKKGEIYLMTDLGGLEKNVMGGNPVLPSLDLKKTQNTS